MARDEKIHSELIIHQKKIPISFTCSWEKFRDLIYVMSVIFGVIKLDKTRIFGIWPGKTPDNWKESCVEVD